MSAKPEGVVGVQLRPKVLAPSWTCFPILRAQSLPNLPASWEKWLRDRRSRIFQLGLFQLQLNRSWHGEDECWGSDVCREGQHEGPAAAWREADAGAARASATIH